jgi:hypothetical protein
MHFHEPMNSLNPVTDGHTLLMETVPNLPWAWEVWTGLIAYVHNNMRNYMSIRRALLVCN